MKDIRPPVRTRKQEARRVTRTDEQKENLWYKVHSEDRGSENIILKWIIAKQVMVMRGEQLRRVSAVSGGCH
jgi:hypothetical protein